MSVAEAPTKVKLPTPDPANNRYPYCITWSPLPLITWIFPFIGHTGIADSRGITYDFQGPYMIGEEYMAFGNPTRYLQLKPSKAKLQDWDQVQSRRLILASCESGMDGKWFIFVVFCFGLVCFVGLSHLFFCLACVKTFFCVDAERSPRKLGVRASNAHDLLGQLPQPRGGMFEHDGIRWGTILRRQSFAMSMLQNTQNAPVWCQIVSLPSF